MPVPLPVRLPRPIVALLCAAPLLGANEGAGAGPALVPLAPLRVPIIDGARSAGSLSVTIVLEATDGAAASRIEATLPVLRAASLAATLEFGRLYASPLLPVDAGRLSADLTQALKAQDAGVRRVLLTEVMARAG